MRAAGSLAGRQHAKARRAIIRRQLVNVLCTWYSTVLGPMNR